MRRISHSGTVQANIIVAIVTFTLWAGGAKGFEEQTLHFQGFESSPSDNWGYSVYKNYGGGKITSSRSHSGSNSFLLWGSSYYNADPFVVFSNADIGDFADVYVEVAFAASGPDSSDDLYIDISYDGGTNWYESNTVKLVDGYYNAEVAFGETHSSDPATVPANPWTIDLPDSVSQVMVRVRFDAKDNSNASIDDYFFDDLRLYAISSNQPPSFEEFPSSLAIVSQELFLVVSATDIDGDQVTLGSENIPTGSSFATTTGVGSVSGTFRFTADVGQADGSVTAMFYAVDTDGTNYGQVILPVKDHLLSFDEPRLITEEGGGPYAFSVSLSRSLDATVTVVCAGTASSDHQADYSLSQTTLVFSIEGTRTKGVLASITDDTFAEGWEDVRLEFSDVSALTAWPYASLDLRIRDDDSLSILTGNLPSYGWYFRDEARRILTALKPDIAGLQEFCVTNTAGPDAFVASSFGTGFSYVVENSSLPNAIVSRWPITDWGTWEDEETSSRDFLWATIDIPGSKPLTVISVHFYYSGGSVSHEYEARDLTSYIVEAGFHTNGLLVICGDLNTSWTGETALAILTQDLVTDERKPEDQYGVRETNSGRTSPYDHILPGATLNRRHVPTVVGGLLFSEGLVFDTRLWTNTPIPWPAQVEDSAAPSMSHMAVMKTFALEEVHRISTVVGSGGRVEPRNPGVSYGMDRTFTVMPDPYYQVDNIWTNGVGIPSALGKSDFTFTWSNVVADGSVTSRFSAILAARGVPQWWLADHGFTHDFDVAATNDFDLDTVETWQEWYADTDPTNQISYPALSRILRSAGSVLSVACSTNCRYFLESSTNLPGGLWEAVYPYASVTGVSSGTLEFTLTNSSPSAVYRVRIERQ